MFFESIILRVLGCVETIIGNLYETTLRDDKLTESLKKAGILNNIKEEFANTDNGSVKMNWYFGPTDIKVLSEYKDLGLADSIPYGWGIFGWINRYIFMPLFGFLGGFMPYGIAIVVMTILVKILL